MKHIRKMFALLLAISVAAACLSSASAYELANQSAGASVSFDGATLELSESIGIRFHVRTAKVTGAHIVTSYVQVSFDADRDGTPEDIMLQPEASTVTFGGNACYEYVLTGIAPDHMGTDIPAQLFVVKDDGLAYYGESITYSVKQYILNVQGAADYDARVLLADLTAYGYAAEAYTGNTTLPASGAEYTTLSSLMSTYAHTDVVADTAASNVMDLSYLGGVSLFSAKVFFRTVGLNLRDNAGILYTFAPAGGENIADYRLKVKIEDITYTYDAAAFVKDSSGNYSFRFHEIQPVQMETPVTAWFVNGSDDTVSATLCYSVASYAYNCYLNRTSAPALNDLTQALLRYGRSVSGYINGTLVEWFNVDEAFAASGKTMTQDVSSCFPTGYSRYTVNGGSASQPYLVDAETLVRLSKSQVVGTGYVKWKSFSDSANVSASIDKFNGVVPVSRLNDPIFMAACLPSEANTFMSARVNAGNHYPLTDDQTYIIAIGAIYRNEDNLPADDDAVTVCLSDFTLILHSDADGWFLADSLPTPQGSHANRMYYLPWSLQSTLGSYTIPSNQIAVNSGHTEISLTGSYFNGTAFSNSQIEEACLHFWANNKYFSTFSLTGSQINGAVVAYRAWVKEADASGKYVATVAADIKNDAHDADHQLFAGYNYLLTNEPRWVIGHNVGPQKRGTILTPADSEQIQTLIGLN